MCLLTECSSGDILLPEKWTSYDPVLGTFTTPVDMLEGILITGLSMRLFSLVAAAGRQVAAAGKTASGRPAPGKHAPQIANVAAGLFQVLAPEKALQPGSICSGLKMQGGGGVAEASIGHPGGIEPNRGRHRL